MKNLINKLFKRTATTNTADIFTRISIHHNKNVRKVSCTTTVKLRGTKKQAIVEVLRKDVPMTAREIAHVTGFSLSYVSVTLYQSFKAQTKESRVFSKAGRRKCLFSGRQTVLYTAV